MTNKQAYAGLLDELRWLKRVTEDDTSNIYGRTDEAISSLLKALTEARSTLFKHGKHDPGFYQDHAECPICLALGIIDAALNSDAPLSIGEGQ